MEAVAPEIDVELVGHHRPGHLDIGDEEHMLVGRARKSDAVELAHGAVRAVAAADPGRADRLAAAVRQLQRRGDAVGVLRDAGQLGVPLDRPAERAQPLAHDPLIVVLAEDQDVGIGRHQAAGVAQRHPRHLPALRPHIGAGGDPAELQRPPDDAELLVDLQRARLHAERPRLLAGPA